MMRRSQSFVDAVSNGGRAFPGEAPSLARREGQAGSHRDRNEVSATGPDRTFGLDAGRDGAEERRAASLPGRRRPPVVVV